MEKDVVRRDPSGKMRPGPPAARASTRPAAPVVQQQTDGTVLLVEDSPFLAKLVSKNITDGSGYAVEVASSYEETSKIINQGSSAFAAAVVDLDLPDSPGGKIVDLSLNAGVPTLVLTGTYDEETRKQVLEKNVVDYYIKEERSLAALNETLHRLRVNPGVKILVVDDSTSFRMLIRRLLDTHRFPVLEATDGVQALEVLDANPDVTLVITDYEMPRMDGIELVSNIRDRHGRDEVAIIGVSSLGSGTLSARYLKFGADDFLTKPFQKEEFYCRVYRSVITIEHMREIKRAAFTDQLTGLHNRLYFFHTAPDLYARAVENGTPFAVAMIDIDFFKRINDTYGHAGGDVALQHLAELLTDNLSEADVIARFGGEEFCILAVGLEGNAVFKTFEHLRKVVEASSLEFEGQTIRFTLSIGVSVQSADSLDSVINRADESLYRAKESGRNRVIIEDQAADGGP
jgi:diguanylate cyclase (GGDEF)-like protein